MADIILDEPLRWRQIAAIANGEARLILGPGALARLTRSNLTARALVERDIPAYGVNTGVGALSDTTVPRARQAELSRNILMSHAVGVGAPLGVPETRAIMAASVNYFALGYSGVRPVLAELITALLNAGCTPVVPAQGSVGYLSHRAHIGLALIGEGTVVLDREMIPARKALERLGLAPLALEAKEGLCLVNGTPCAAGMAALAMARAQRLLDWADAVAAMSFETLRCQTAAIDPVSMKLRASPGLLEVTATLQRLLQNSQLLAKAAGARTQDALSLRAIPQVHGAIRDVWRDVEATVDRELACVTDNPVIAGTPQAPLVYSQAHAVGAAIGLAMDHLAVAMAQLGLIAERRLDRLVNPLVSGLPAFLAPHNGVASGFMIAQYTALSLVSENRRLAAPASLDAGITSGLQEDMLCHATPAVLKLLDILANVQNIVAIEWMAACQAYDLLGGAAAPAPALVPLYMALRRHIAFYADERPLGDDIAAVAHLIGNHAPDDPAMAAPQRTAA